MLLSFVVYVALNLLVLTVTVLFWVIFWLGVLDRRIQFSPCTVLVYSRYDPGAGKPLNYG